MLDVGQEAPDFTLPVEEGKSLTLSDMAEKKNVVLYFYPKDDTPGCTQESCDFRDNLKRLKDNDTVVWGVSRDDLESHAKFTDKYSLPFPLLADIDGEVCEDYGCWVEKSMYGKRYMGIERSTFLIGKDGIVKAAWRKVKVEGHVEEVLDTINAL